MELAHGLSTPLIFRHSIPRTVNSAQGAHGLGAKWFSTIELIEPSDNPSIYTEFIDAGKEGIHHICYWANIDARTHFTSNGYGEAQYGLPQTETNFCTSTARKIYHLLKSLTQTNLCLYARCAKCSRLGRVRPYTVFIMDPIRKVEAIQDINLMLHEQARLADLNRPE